MALRIGDIAPDFERETTEVALGNPTHNGCAPKELYQILAWTTPCSPMVFYGLLAWARLNAQVPTKAEIKTATGQHASARVTGYERQGGGV